MHYTGDFDTHAPTFTVALWEKTPTAGSFGLPGGTFSLTKSTAVSRSGLSSRRRHQRNGCADLLPYPHEASGSEILMMELASSLHDF